ncbi:uncharacterized protein LOC118179553 [Stegodyphus dumicola]|uniref:uncharacterized protein LOC118179553 n=1 Tax=Stegodyphus dumicola TaxID=202533 RepID=UPI0015AB3E95|nr:uncharacterized protein LOC118179553 [Stegodyphus dumicola]
MRIASMGHETFSSSTVSVPIAWAAFGGSTCLLFLLCYLCQKKLQERDPDAQNTTAQQVYVVSSAARRSLSDKTVRQEPPDYESIFWEKSLRSDQPPSYECAVGAKNLPKYSLTL